MKKTTTTRPRGEQPRILGKSATRALAAYLAKEGQYLLPMVELIESSQAAVEELLDVVGRAAVEAVLTLSARGVAGEKHRGRRGGEVRWHGSQPGRVALAERRLRVQRPRLRRRGAGEVEVPAYAAMREDAALGGRMLSILLAGVSTRQYERVIPEMADTVGVSRSAVSREFTEASAGKLRELCERRFDGVDLLVIYVDGMVFGDHHIVAAVGVDREGRKHALGVAHGSSENERVVRDLLAGLAERGVAPGRRRLFVIDGSKALRSAIGKVYGEDSPVQRCRNHKVKNVADYLPKELKDQAKAAMRAAYRLPWREGIARLRKQAEWLRQEYPGAAASLLEGLEETFTVNRLGLSPSLRRCLGTTNLIESPQGTVRRKSRRVSRWRNGEMVLRWAGASLLDAERSFRRIMGYRDLWMLQAILDEGRLDAQEEVA